MELVESKQSSTPTPYLKQITFAWCFMSLLIITLDLLSFVGVLPFEFSGGYIFPVVAFVYFSLGPRVWAIFGTLSSCFTPAFLFLLLNVMIIAILLSSGCLTKDDLSKLQQTPTSSPPDSVTMSVEPVSEEGRGVSIAKTRSLSRSSSGKSTNKAAGSKKTKRQLSAPQLGSDVRLAQGVPDQEQVFWDHHHHHHHQPSSLIIMELNHSDSGAETLNPKTNLQGLAPSNHLMTCDQDVFNKIIGNYIDKFKQDMRKQELIQGQLLTSSYSSKW